MNVGFIGTGTMGQPMVANLLKKGFGVLAWDVVPTALAAAVKLGATAAGSIADVAKQSDLIVTMLPSSSNVEAVYLGDGGILSSVPAGRLCVDMSTIDPNVSRRVAAALARKQVRFMDAPVSGGVPGAVDGTLAIMVGGDARDLEEARPALAAMGANVIHVGAVGTGEAAKLCNNLIAGVAAVAVSEAFRIAEGFGVDPKVLTDVISKSSGNTWVMQQAHPVPMVFKIHLNLFVKISNMFFLHGLKNHPGSKTGPEMHPGKLLLPGVQHTPWIFRKSQVNGFMFLR